MMGGAYIAFYACGTSSCHLSCADLAVNWLLRTPGARGRDATDWTHTYNAIYAPPGLL